MCGPAPGCHSLVWQNEASQVYIPFSGASWQILNGRMLSVVVFPSDLMCDLMCGWLLRLSICQTHIHLSGGDNQQRRGGAQQTSVPAFLIPLIPHSGHHSIAPFGFMIPLGLIDGFIRKQYKHVTKEERRGGAGAEYDMYQLSTYSEVGKMYPTSLHVAEYWRAWLTKKKPADGCSLTLVLEVYS